MEVRTIKAEVMNYLAYLMWNILDIYIIVRYMKHLYGRIEKQLNLYFLTAALCVIFVTASMNPGKDYFNPIAIIIMSFILLAFYSPNFQKKLLFSIILLTVTGFWQIISYVAVYTIWSIEISKGFLTICVFHIGYILLLELAPRLIKSNQKSMPYHLWSFLLSIPLTSIAAYWCIALIALNNKLLGKQATALVLLLIIILYINLMVFFLFDRLSTLVNTRTENALLVQQITYQGQHYQQLEIVHNRIRSIRHDMKNNIQMASYLLENGEIKELGEYLSSLSNSINKVEKVVATLNPALDSVLNIKISELQEYGIQVFTDIVVPQGVKISFKQSVILLGNIMDNAKEACTLLPEKERWMRLKISYTSHILLLSLQNPLIQSKEMANRKPVLEKKDHLFHGLGLKNVKRVVDEFHGTMTTELKENKFSIKIILYDV